MKIGIVGTGGMGTGFAEALKGKHEVWLGSRDTERGKQAADQAGVAGGGSYSDVVAGADLVILAVPWTAVDETLSELGDLAGATVIDITNPYSEKGLVPLEGTSTAEEIQKKIPGAKVVKGWNHVYSPNLTRPEIDGEASSVFIAGDDQTAKESAFQVARDMGFAPVDAGPLEATRHLERLLAVMGGLGLNSDRPIRILQRT
ncbi:MAG: NADPH-dependent F420 reductase [Actinomycetota bacterium]